MKRGLIVLFLLIGFSPVLAQNNTCPDVVQTIIDLVESHCAFIGRNQVCYGNTTLQAEPQDGVTGFAFDQPGDFVNVGGLRTLRAAPLNATNNDWGVAMMKVQANVPDTLPGQGVTFLLFGNVEIENAVPFDATGVNVNASADSVLRGTPSADGPIVGALTTGQPAVAINRSTDSTWVRVELEGAGSRAGWIPAASLDSSGWNTVPVFDAAAAMPGPMQAFRLKTTPLETQCLDAPPDGILVQTPQGDVNVELTINDVRIQLGSTIFITAQPNDVMTLSVLEGHAQVTALGQTADVPQGMQVSVPMTDNLQPAERPGTVVPYDAGALSHLPISLLPDQITIATVNWASGQSLCVTSANGAWLRAAPSSGSADIVLVLANGDAVAANGDPQYDGLQSWWPVRTGDNRTGWIEQASLTACDKPVVPPCTPRTDWLARYTVVSGDTLSKIAVAAGVSTAELSQANCIADASFVYTGQIIRVPRDVVIITPVATVIDPTPDIMPSGIWDFTVYQQDCRTTTVQTMSLNVTVSPDKSIITISPPNGSPLSLPRIANGIYQTVISSGTTTMSAQAQLQQAQQPSRSTTIAVTVTGFISGRTQARLDISIDCGQQPSQSSP